MVMAADLSERLALVPLGTAGRVRELVRRAGLPVLGPNLGVDSYLHHMRVDKKALGGQIRFVLLNSLGSAVVREAPDSLIAEAILQNCAA
jgi:3-dehydroquinate synthase